MRAKMYWGVLSLKKKQHRPGVSTLTQNLQAPQYDFWVTLLQNKYKPEEMLQGGID